MDKKSLYWRLSGFYFFYFAFVGVTAPYLGLYLQSLAFSAWQIGILLSLLQVTRMFAPNVWGWLAERQGRRVPVIRFAAAASLLSFLGVYVDQSFTGVFVTLALMSVFWTAPLPLVEATTLSHLGAQTDRYGRIRLWGSVGFIVSAVGLGALLDRHPAGIVPWAITAALAGIAAFARFIPEAGVAPHEHDRLPLREVARRPEVRALIAAAFLMTAAHAPYYAFYSIYLVDHGYGKATVGGLWALGVVCEIAAFLAMPRLFARASPKALLGVCFLGTALRFLMVAWGVQYLGVLLLAQVLHALSFAVYHAAAITLVHRYFPGRHQGRGQALYNSVAYGAGGTAGTLASGWAWGDLGGVATFSAAALTALLAFAVFRRARPASVGQTA